MSYFLRKEVWLMDRSTLKLNELTDAILSQMDEKGFM